MTERQYKLVKLFLDSFKVSPRRLASNWNIKYSEVLKVASSVNYEGYVDGRPMEDFMSGFGL